MAHLCYAGGVVVCCYCHRCRIRRVLFRQFYELQRKGILILLIYFCVTLALGLLVFWEFRIDGRILKNPEKFHPLLIRFKHWVYNAPRLIVWAIPGIHFFLTRTFWPAWGVLALTATANFFLFRFWHDWLYQWLILTRYKKGTYNGFLNSFVVAFHCDSETPLKEENSFWDKHLQDTSANRLMCFQIYVLLSLFQIIAKLY